MVAADMESDMAKCAGKIGGKLLLWEQGNFFLSPFVFRGAHYKKMPKGGEGVLALAQMVCGSSSVNIQLLRYLIFIIFNQCLS